MVRLSPISANQFIIKKEVIKMEKLNLDDFLDGVSKETVGAEELQLSAIAVVW